MTQLAERHDAFVAQFEAFRRDPVFGSGVVGRARETAFERFLNRGLPSTRDEEWRFTSVAPIAKVEFARADAGVLDDRELSELLVAGLGPQVVVVNGRVSKALSSLSALPAGVTIETLRDASGDTAYAPSGSTVFADLNDALFEDMVVLRVAPKVRVEAPIQILMVTVTGEQPAVVLPRLVVDVGEAAEVALVESYAGSTRAQTLTSAVTRVRLGAGAVVDHVKLQREPDAAFHMAAMDVRLDRSSTFRSHALTFGGRIARNDIRAVLDGEGAECTLNGLYVATGDGLVDTHTTIDHAKPHCPSHEIYKGILGGRARAVFNGKILVRPDAQKTDAKQTNRALLLTDDAQVNTKPQLEIFADDVKCTHGAAVGQIDEDASFYLRARGIGEAEARIMLIHAFAGEILDGIKASAVREVAARLVDRKLALEPL